MSPTIELLKSHRSIRKFTNQKISDEALLELIRAGQGDAVSIRDYDEQVRAYYRTRTGGNKDMSWSEQMSGLLSRESWPHMRGLLRDRGFAMK